MNAQTKQASLIPKTKVNRVMQDIILLESKQENYGKIACLFYPAQTLPMRGL